MSLTRTKYAFTMLAVLAALTLLLAGCEPTGPEFVAEGRSYTLNTALELSDTIDAGGLAEQPTSKANELRHEALVALRKQGDMAENAAKVITATFPAETSGVPYYVERALYHSEPALIIVEAIGPQGGTLSDRRVWVLSLDGEVLLSGTR